MDAGLRLGGKRWMLEYGVLCRGEGGERVSGCIGRFIEGYKAFLSLSFLVCLEK